jgi:hypothetical protein
MPIIGIVASSKLKQVPNSYESIETISVGSGGQASIVFDNIPSTYKHLQVRALIKSTTGGTDTWALSTQAYLNSDTTVANYAYHRIIGNAATAADSGGANAIGTMGFTPGPGAADVFAPTIIDILDYANTNKYKTFRALSGSDDNAISNAAFIGVLSQLWKNTAAVHTVQLQMSSGSYAQYSHFALYGIKG